MPERRLLVHQPDAQEVYMDGRSELDKRRLAQETEVEAERGRKYKAKLTTRGDVMAIIELYNTHKILPLAARPRCSRGCPALPYGAVVAEAVVGRQDHRREGAQLGAQMARAEGNPFVHLCTSDTEAEKPPEKELEMRLTVTNRGGARGGFGCAPRGASCGDDVGAHTNGLPGPGVHS